MFCFIHTGPLKCIRNEIFDFIGSFESAFEDKTTVVYGALLKSGLDPKL